MNYKPPKGRSFLLSNGRKSLSPASPHHTPQNLHSHLHPRLHTLSLPLPPAHLPSPPLQHIPNLPLPIPPLLLPQKPLKRNPLPLQLPLLLPLQRLNRHPLGLYPLAAFYKGD